MEFEEKTAKELIEKFKLDEKTLNVWKSRGKIPDKYFKEGFEIKKPASSNADKIMIDRIVKVIASKELDSKVMIDLSGVKDFYNKSTGRINFHETDILNMKKEIKRLKIDILKSFEINSFKKAETILGDCRVKKYVIINSLSRSQIDMIVRRGIISDYELERIKESFIKFAITLNID